MSANWWQSEFELDGDLAYLNHAGVAPWPRRTRDAVVAFAEENLHRGASGYPRWIEREGALRESLRRLINARSVAEIALLKNTSEALSVVAHGLSWQPGDNVVISNQEFPSNRIVWESLQRHGVTVRSADLAQGSSPEQALLDQIDARTRLLAVSSVQYGTGLKMDLSLLGRALRGSGVKFCVDAIQSLGAIPFDVEAIGADFVAADGHKWLLAPEGLALFYCRRQWLEQLELHQYGWHMVADAGDYDRQSWQPAADARRFECGSPNMTGVTGLQASLTLLDEVGIERVAVELQRRVDLLVERLGADPRIELITPAAADRRAGIVTFRHRDRPAALLHRQLSAQQIVCAARAGGVRFSPHFYTPQSAIERAIDAVLGPDG